MINELLGNSVVELYRLLVIMRALNHNASPKSRNAERSMSNAKI